MSIYKMKSFKSSYIDISAAVLHIIAMILMLMDHLWATLFSGARLADLCRETGFSDICFMTVEGYFYTHNLKNIFSDCFCLRYCQRYHLI